MLHKSCTRSLVMNDAKSARTQCAHKSHAKKRDSLALDGEESSSAYTKHSTIHIKTVSFLCGRLDACSLIEFSEFRQCIEYYDTNYVSTKCEQRERPIIARYGGIRSAAKVQHVGSMPGRIQKPAPYRNSAASLFEFLNRTVFHTGAQRGAYGILEIKRSTPLKHFNTHNDIMLISQRH